MLNTTKNKKGKVQSLFLSKKTHLLTILITAFCFTSNAQYTKLLDFAGTSNGSFPYSLISDGIFLYGMTNAGGTNNWGSVFKIMPDGTGFSKLLDFNDTNGINPVSHLFYDGTFLFGMTYQGGTNTRGVLFKIMPDGTGYSKLLDFNDTIGSYPRGSLISDGTFLYGMTRQGGTNNNGVAFKIMPDGTGYVKLVDFAGASNGSSPYGSFLSDGTFLYGTTLNGGTNNLGVIFKMMPDGSGYSKLLDFEGVSNGNHPYGSLISDGTFLYGMTYSGGTYNQGVVFKIMPDGTGYAKLLDFAGVSNGSYPYGSLISDGTFLYGMTSAGGTDNLGVLFKILPDGTGYVKLLDFAGTSNGSTPYGSLISDGTFLYGTTSNGGINNMGVIFKYALTTGIENETENTITFYPNPFTNSFSIKGTSSNGEIILLDIMGKEIIKQKCFGGETKLNIGFLPQGFYILNYKDGNKTVNIKIIKQ